VDDVLVRTELLELLDRRRTAIVDDAARRLTELHLGRYDLVGDHEVRLRLDLLHARVVSAIGSRTSAQIVDYASDLARQRFATGYPIEILQSAFDALEAAIWNEVALELPSEQHAAALGLVSATVGAGKDALGWTYASLGAHHRVPVLDLDALVAGSDAAGAES
jgi:hypothetical protein